MGSFKIRGACNALQKSPWESIRNGIYTSSAGNFAQGIAWNALQMNIPCTIIVPDNAPQTKLAAMERLRAEVIKLPYAAWWQVMQTHHYQGMSGQFIHPVCNRDVIAGKATFPGKWCGTLKIKIVDFSVPIWVYFHVPFLFAHLWKSSIGG